MRKKKQKKNKVWRLWAKALGEKSGKDDREADIVAGIRTLIFVSYLVTNVAIVANAVRHWNDGVNSNVVTGTNPQVSHVSGTTSTEKVGRVSRPLVFMERIMGCR